MLQTVLSVILNIRFDFWIYRWFPGNILLAGIPLVLSILLIEAKKRSNKIVYAIVFLLWLLFFPNAPYMITDIMHISALGLYGGSREIAAWIGLFYIATSALLGPIVGLLALDNAVKSISRRAPAIVTVAAASLLSGYAMYIGRFLRFNSWDLLRSATLIKILIKDFDLFAAQFSLLAAFFVLMSYVAFVFLTKRPMKRFFGGKNDGIP